MVASGLLFVFLFNKVHVFYISHATLYFCFIHADSQHNSNIYDHPLYTNIHLIVFRCCNAVVV